MSRIIFWSIVSGIFITMLFLISDIIAPFFIAAIISYMLQPTISNISLRYKLSRSTVASVVFIVFFSIFVVVIVILLPVIYQQTSLLISKIPIYKKYLQTELIPIFITKIYAIDPSIADGMKDSISNFINAIFLIITKVINNLWHYTVATINLFILMLLIPVVLFHFLRDWPKMVTTIKLLLPLKNKSKIQEILSSIDRLLSVYIRGQLNICILLSIFYGVSLSIIGVDLGLLLGILSGFFIIIPFIGTFISFSLTIIIGYSTFGITKELSYILIIYLIGSIVEGYILTPQIIGDKIGLHPLWVIFAVLACGSLFGFIGIFFAIPIAGIIKVLLLSLIQCYKSSGFYKT